MRKYELMFITQPELEEEERQAFVERVKQTMTDNGAEVIHQEDMGRRKLAYSIAKWQEGHYTLLQASMERPAMQAVERDLKLSEDVLRYLLVRIDEDEE